MAGYTIDDAMTQANSARTDVGTLASNIRAAGFGRTVTAGGKTISATNGNFDLSSVLSGTGTAPTTSIAPVAQGNLAVV